MCLCVCVEDNQFLECLEYEQKTECKPTFSTVIKDVEVVEGSAARFDCKIEGMGTKKTTRTLNTTQTNGRKTGTKNKHLTNYRLMNKMDEIINRRKIVNADPVFITVQVTQIQRSCGTKTISQSKRHGIFKLTTMKMETAVW